MDSKESTTLKPKKELLKMEVDRLKKEKENLKSKGRITWEDYNLKHDKHLMEIKSLKIRKESILSRITELENFQGSSGENSSIEELQKCYMEINSVKKQLEMKCREGEVYEQLKSTMKENDDLKFINTLLTKRLQDAVKEQADFNNNLKSEIENMKLQNEKLKSELENAKLQNKASSSEVDKLMALYRCSEKEKYIASMKLLEAEENIRKLRNELHSLQNFMASRNETKRETLRLTDFDAGSEVTDVARFLSLIPDENSTQMKPVNESEKLETSAAQSMKKDEILLEKGIMNLIGKADKFCEEFEAKFDERKNWLMTKLTSCDDQLQELKKLCVKQKEEKLIHLDLIKEMDGVVSKYRRARLR